VRRSAFIVFALMGFASSMAQAATIVSIEAPITSGSADVNGPPLVQGFGLQFRLSGPNVSVIGHGGIAGGPCFIPGILTGLCTPGSTQRAGFEFGGEGGSFSDFVTVGDMSFVVNAVIGSEASVCSESEIR
jgi:hypothetical protein